MKREAIIKKEIAKFLAQDEFLSYQEAKYYAIMAHHKNKARFFALYFDQMVYVLDYNNKPIVYRNFGSRSDDTAKGLYKESYLELTPLSQISDEDAIEVAGLMDWETPISREDFREIRDQLIVKVKHNWVTWVCVDFLRSRGYYVGDGTEVEYGWVVLKTK